MEGGARVLQSEDVSRLRRGDRSHAVQVRVAVGVGEVLVAIALTNAEVTNASVTAVGVLCC